MLALFQSFYTQPCYLLLNILKICYLVSYSSDRIARTRLDLLPERILDKLNQASSLRGNYATVGVLPVNPGSDMC